MTESSGKYRMSMPTIFQSNSSLERVVFIVEKVLREFKSPS